MRLLRGILPASLRSQENTVKPGPVRRLLRRIGPSLAASPFRRLSQTLCFVLFAILFFYVAFPYTAKPAKVWPGWVAANVNAETGVVEVEAPAGATDRPPAGATVYAAEPPPADAAASSTGPQHFGQFTVAAAATPNLLTLTPTSKPTEDALGRMSFSTAKWTLSEKAPGDWPSHYADDLAKKEKIAAEGILIIDPLVSLSTAVAAKSWVWSLTFAGIILAISVFIPRGFCGYICPLGTLIDLFDWLIGKRVTRFRVADDGWWVHIKYYTLLTVMIAAMFGVLLSGFVAAIPVITRGFLFIFKPFHDASARGWHNVPPMNGGQILSIVLFFGVLAMGFWKPRFWCKYVCPSGAVFSVGNLLRATERKVESSCIKCNKCVEICPFDAIKPDFTTRGTDCTLCQSCGGVCPTHAIKFVSRWNRIELKVINDPPTHETPIGRRGFLSAGVGVAAAAAVGIGSAVGIRKTGAKLADGTVPLPVRPPGSVPEEDFLQLCIRCGECFRACPNDVLQPLGFQQGLEGLWTPAVKADWAGCEPSCNGCGQVCPTGAIRALSLAEKKSARMGLAIVNEKTCLPFAGKEECQLCVDECNSAGYHAIEFIRHGTKADEEGNPVDGTGMLAPVVRADLCVGCGLCQTRCYAINVAEKKLLTKSAIIIEAGEGKEDRLMSGSYVELRIKGKKVENAT
ncbi:4Fe-4S binding protein [Humisphaera borealis]|uniref:4Fe-4S binding protein n=2 Tax=Humisphaera borealis TaxID=2807512 RepID=A0A7M2X4N3_9BACT|nr:4Fe-4S binding protein [Humisphaera borealis]